jgi:Flp pilus assembly protein TadD
MVLKLESRVAELERMRKRGTVSTDVPAEFSLALGSAYLRSGKLPEAEREYVEAVKVNPKMGEAYNNLAVVYLNTGRINEAENAVKQAEKAGFKVHPQLKKDIAARKG